MTPSRRGGFPRWNFTLERECVEQAWEAPEVRRGEAASVVEEVAARGTLKSIGLRLGYSEAYADRAGKAAIIDAAKALAAANDNKKVEPAVPVRGAV